MDEDKEPWQVLMNKILWRMLEQAAIIATMVEATILELFETARKG